MQEFSLSSSSLYFHYFYFNVLHRVTKSPLNCWTSYVNLTSFSLHAVWPHLFPLLLIWLDPTQRGLSVCLLCLDLSQSLSLFYWLQLGQLACKYLPVAAAAAVMVGPLKAQMGSRSSLNIPWRLCTCSSPLLSHCRWFSSASRSQSKHFLSSSFKHKLGSG